MADTNFNFNPKFNLNPKEALDSWPMPKQEAVQQPEAEAATQPKAATPETWQTRIKAGTATDDDIRTAAEEAKAGRYTPGTKTQEAINALQTAEQEAEAESTGPVQPEADNDLDIMRRNFEQWAKENGEEPTDENFALWYQMGSGEPEYNRGSEAGWEPSQEDVTNGQDISDEIQNSAFNEDGTPNEETIEGVNNAAKTTLGVELDENGNIVVESFKAPSLWESQDKWGKASIVLTAISALATALSFGRIPPINFMALSGAKEKWITEAQSALENYNTTVGPQLKLIGEAKGENTSEAIRAQQNEEIAKQAAKIEGIASTAHDKAMTEVNKINWNNQAEANAYLEKAKAELTKSLKYVDKDVQTQLLSLQQDYAQQMAQLQNELQMAQAENNNELKQKLMQKAHDLQATLQSDTAEAMTQAIKDGKIDHTKTSKVVRGLNGISAASQALGTVKQGTDVVTGALKGVAGVIDAALSIGAL